MVTEATETISFRKIGQINNIPAEISAYDSRSKRLFVVAGEPTVSIIDLSDPTRPRNTNIEIDVTEFYPTAGGVNSVAVSRSGIVALAVEADPIYNAGRVLLFNNNGEFLNSVEVNALPDMLTFTSDGKKLLVANEGEPVEVEDSETGETTIFDPQGSVSVIDLSRGVRRLTQADVMTADFTAYNGRETELRSKGVRIFPDRNFAQDVEPEYITVSSDNTTAWVTLQEQNAVAVIDVATGTVTDIQPLGVKDHSRGQPELTQIELTNLPPLGTTAAGQEIKLGGFSGLWYEGTDETTGNLIFYTIPDRGPNPNTLDVDGDGINERPFALPDYQARIVKLEVTPDYTQMAVTGEIFLREEDGITPISGLPNLDDEAVDEQPVDLFGNPIDLDPLGGDFEGIARDAAGNFWMVDEYRPAVYQFSSTGVLLNRYVPEGTAALVDEESGTFGTETLPSEYITREQNRGFEAIALDAEAGIVYAFIQSPLANPDEDTFRESQVIRILALDTETGTPVSEYVYLLEDPIVRPDGRVDKIGDAVYAGDGKFQVIERDAGLGETAKKYIFEIDLKGATNVLGVDFGSETLEQMSADDLANFGIQAVNKRKVTNLPSIGYVAGDKPEGLTLLPDGSLAVINDNDFGIAEGDIPLDGSAILNPNPTPITMGIIEFGEGNQLDASDEDGGINLNNWPVFGMDMPDAIASFKVRNKTYYLTANEGDSRGEEVRVEDITLDPTVFPNAAEIQQPENLGRLQVSSIDGDIDGDGDYDQLFPYGTRSFTIRDEFGNLVFDSGDEFERITAELVPELFNSDGDTDSFDSRSDNKGPEPEGAVVGVIDNRTYGFIGLERVGGVMVYDITEPENAEFVQYIPGGNNISPEGLSFIPGRSSPNGDPLLVVSNEGSGSIAVYSLA